MKALASNAHGFIALSLLALAWGSAPTAGWAQGPPPASKPLSSDLSVEEAVRFAKEHSPLLAVADASLDELEAEYLRAAAQAYPKGTLDVLLAPMARQYGDPVNGGTDLGEWGIFVYTKIEGALPLLTFGKISALKAAAGLGIAVGKALRRVMEGEIEYRVRLAYVALAVARELSAIIEEGEDYLKKAEKHLDELDREDSPEYDPVDRAKLRVFKAEVLARRLDASRAERTSKGVLRFLLGIDDRPEKEVTFSTRWDDDVSKIVPLSLKKLLSMADELRPELVALRKGVAARTQEVEARTAAFYPDIFVTGRFAYGYSNVAEPQSSPFANDPFNSYSAGGGIGMRWGFDLGDKWAELRGAEARLRKAEGKLRQARGAARAEVGRLYTELLARKKLAAAYRDATEAARGWVIAKTDLYQNGLGELKDVLEALTQFFSARVKYVEAVARVHEGLAALARACGTRQVLADTREGRIKSALGGRTSMEGGAR